MNERQDAKNAKVGKKVKVRLFSRREGAEKRMPGIAYVCPVCFLCGSASLREFTSCESKGQQGILSMLKILSMSIIPSLSGDTAENASADFADGADEDLDSESILIFACMKLAAKKRKRHKKLNS